jgi:hypothetical protein
MMDEVLAHEERLGLLSKFELYEAPDGRVGDDGIGMMGCPQSAF